MPWCWTQTALPQAFRRPFKVQSCQAKTQKKDGITQLFVHVPRKIPTWCITQSLAMQPEEGVIPGQFKVSILSPPLKVKDIYWWYQNNIKVLTLISSNTQDPSSPQIRVVLHDWLWLSRYWNLWQLVQSPTRNIDHVPLLKPFPQQKHLFKFRTRRKPEASLLLVLTGAVLV